MKTALIAAMVSTVVAVGSSSAATLIITSKNIKNGTIQAVDISAKAKRVLKGNRGPAGEQGPAGQAGPQGPPGPPGIANAGRFVLDSSFVNPGDPHSVEAFIATGSMNSECLTTINGSHVAWPGTISGAFCNPVVHDGVQGLEFSVVLADPAPPDFIVVITAWQKGAEQYPNAVPCGGHC